MPNGFDNGDRDVIPGSEGPSGSGPNGAPANQAERDRLDRQIGAGMQANAHVVQGMPPPPDPQAAARAAAERALNNHFEYGGAPGEAAKSANYFRTGAEGAQNRQGEQINYGHADEARRNAYDSRGGQYGMVDMMRQRAQGLVPSIAQMQGDRQMRQMQAAQMSAAASARGPAGLALAQQGAAANTAAGQSQISNAVQINAAAERERAEQAAFGGYSTMRQGDMGQQGMDADMAQKQAALNAAQRAQNDAYSLGLYGNEVDVNKAQLQAQGNQVGIATGAQTAANQLSQQKGQYDNDQYWKYAGLGLGAIGTGAALYGSGMFGGGAGPSTPGQGGVAGGGGDPGGNSDAYGEQGYGGSMAGYDPNDPNNSDVTAKQDIRPLQAQAWEEGRKAALSDFQKLSGKNGAELKGYGDNEMASAVRNMKANAWDEGRSAPQSPRMDPREAELHRVMGGSDAQRQGLMAQGPAVGGDPVTAQFAQGLAPSSYDYKDGMGSPGRKVGPMAQNMAANPVTGTAIRQNPQTGLLSIDNNDGIKVGLAGVGHLAKKQQETDQAISKLMAMAKSMQGNTQAQSDGLMSQGPSVSDTYLNYVRGH